MNRKTKKDQRERERTKKSKERHLANRVEKERKKQFVLISVRYSWGCWTTSHQCMLTFWTFVIY